MLTREENELLCRVGPQTPTGRLIRRYWIPALMSSELEPGGAPKRVRLLGEDLVAFRDARGRVGLLDENCPHRGASLVLARNESSENGECGLRCLYHGWKIDVAGTVLETPAEPDEHGFKNRVRAPSYPVRESGGLVWAYLGPPADEPRFMDFEFTTLPAPNVMIMKIRQDCNYAQCIEGVIDSAHSNYLHTNSIKPAAGPDVSVYKPDLMVDRPSNDGKPRIELRNTWYGFRYGAIRKPTRNADRKKYIRVSLFMAPIYAMFPAPVGWGNMQAMVPIDDEHTMFYYMKYRYDEPITDQERAQHENWSGFRTGIDIDADFRKRIGRDNTWLQDRAAMERGESYSGIYGVNNEDIAVQESMGPIYDRTKEHLGTSDIAVIRMRRLMIDAARGLAERGTVPLGLTGTDSWSVLRAEEGTLPLETPWEILSAYGDETAGAAT
jgi:phthalate 4,5-dioxygenase